MNQTLSFKLSSSISIDIMYLNSTSTSISKISFLAMLSNSWLCLPYIFLTTANFRKTHSVSILRHKCSLCLLLIRLIKKCVTVSTNKPIIWLRFTLICDDSFTQNLFAKYLKKLSFYVCKVSFLAVDQAGLERTEA